MRKWFSNSWESEWLCSAVSLPRVPLPFLILNVGSQKKFRVLINLSGCSCSNMLSCPYQQFFVTGGTACAKKRTAAIQLAGKERTEGFLWDKEEHGFCSWSSPTDFFSSKREVKFTILWGLAKFTAFFGKLLPLVFECHPSDQFQVVGAFGVWSPTQLLIELFYGTLCESWELSVALLQKMHLAKINRKLKYWNPKTQKSSCYFLTVSKKADFVKEHRFSGLWALQITCVSSPFR